MTEYVHLIGVEQIQTAANSMRSAADEMQRAASSLDYSLQQNQRFMDDWLQRFEAAIAKLPIPPSQGEENEPFKESK